MSLGDNQESIPEPDTLEYEVHEDDPLPIKGFVVLPMYNGATHSETGFISNDHPHHSDGSLVLPVAPFISAWPSRHKPKPNRRRQQKRSGASRKKTDAVAAPLVPSMHRPATLTAGQLLDLYQQAATVFTGDKLAETLRRMDGSPALIHATSAVVSMSQSRLRSMPIAQGRHLANQKYTEAVGEINSSKTVAEPLLYAINLLYYVEGYSFNVPAMKTHAWGLHSILAADPERWSRNVVCRDVILGTRPATIEGCIAAGKPSPFEEDLWFQYEIPNDSSFGAATLFQVAHRILFKIPRLVIYIRKIRSGKYDFFDACETIGLAHRILSIRSMSAFYSVLKHCEQRETISEIDRVHATTSLRFADLGVLDALLDYCRARLSIITLCLALQHWLAGYVTPDHDMIVREQADLVQQALSCWEQCMETRRFPKCMCFTLFPVYGAAQQMKRRGLPVEELMSWLELKSLVAFPYLRKFRGESDLASTWDMFCGGSPRKSIYWQWAD